MSERSMIIRMARLQQRYDHRLRDLVQRTKDVTIATNLGVPRSTARGWLDKAPRVVVGLDVTDLRALELQQEVLRLRRRVKKLTALLRLALALLRSSGFALTHERLPHGDAKTRLLRAVDRAGEFVPLGALLRFLRFVAESVPCLATATPVLSETTSTWRNAHDLRRSWRSRSASRLRTRLARPPGAPCSGSFMRWMEEDDGLIVILAQAGHRSSALPIGERSIRDRGILRRTKRDPACAGVPRQYPLVPHLESASGRG